MKRHIFGIVLLLSLLACNLPVRITPVVTAVPTYRASDTPLPQPAATVKPSPLPTDTLFPTVTATSTELPTQTPTNTLTPTATPFPTSTPTYSILRGKVNVARLSCRYGPGWMYLYLYGMLEGVTQDVLGRTDTGNWVLTQSRGDNKSCWVKTEFLDLNGDVMSLEVVYPDKYTIPQSNQNYILPYDVTAVRSGSEVTITWKSGALRPGDEEDENMVVYIVETWTCVDGVVSFKPIGTNYAEVTVTDESDCDNLSHGRIYFQDKHGFTGPSEVPWP